MTKVYKDKLKPIEALSKIKVLINRFYEKIGREIVNDIDMARLELLEDIEDVIERVVIPVKNVVADKLEMDNE